MKAPLRGVLQAEQLLESHRMIRPQYNVLGFCAAEEPPDGLVRRSAIACELA